MHCPNRNVFSDRWNSLYDESSSFGYDGRLFHSPGPTAMNTLSPKVLYVRVTTHVWLAVERSHRSRASATRRQSSARYGGEMPDSDWCTSVATLKSTRWRTGSQCSCNNSPNSVICISVMCDVGVQFMWRRSAEENRCLYQLWCRHVSVILPRHMASHLSHIMTTTTFCSTSRWTDIFFARVTNRAVAGPWKSLNLCLKVLESAWIRFSKTPWPNKWLLSPDAFPGL